VIGRATFKISRELREYALKRLREGAVSITFDLSECRGMDSTFMGVLAMLGLQARGKAAIIIVNASEHHRELLDGIGISRLFQFSDEAIPEVNWHNLCGAATAVRDMGQLADTILDAHKTLMNVSADNVPKFKDVVDMLSTELDRPNPKGASKA